VTRHLFLAAGLALAACAARPPPVPAPAASPALPAAATPVGPPLVARWVARSASPGRIDLTARLTFNAEFREGVTVSVTLPRGVTLLTGQPTLLATAPAGGGVVELDYALALQPQAVGEILLTADLQTPGYGVHAQDVYPVGGAAARATAQPAVDTSGPNVKVEGKDLGPSTPVR